MYSRKLAYFKTKIAFFLIDNSSSQSLLWHNKYQSLLCFNIYIICELVIYEMYIISTLVIYIE